MYKLTSLLLITIFLLPAYSDSTETPADLNPLSELGILPPRIITTSLKNKQNTGYHMKMQIGHPNKRTSFEMLVDISAPWIWVPDSQCVNCFHTMKHSSLYDCKYNNFTCFQNQNRGIKALKYPIGSVYAFNGYDQIYFDGLPEGSAVNHTVAFTIEVSKDFYNINADGVFGLGIHNRTANPHMISVVDLMHEQGLIENKSFSLFLTNNKEGEDEESQITFGGYNPAKLEADEVFKTVPLSTKNGWTVKATGMMMEDTDVGVTPAHVILSTTFSDIALPKEDLMKVLDALETFGISCKKPKKHGKYICPCKDGDLAWFPDITVELGNTTLKIPNSVYMSLLELDLEDQEENVLIKKYKNCELRLTTVNGKDGNHGLEKRWIFGRNVLSHYHTLFDVENKSVGFAIAKSPVIGKAFSLSPIMWMMGLVAVFMGVSCLVFCFQCVNFKRKFRRGDMVHKEESIYSALLQINNNDL